jgi:hypothetical protein
MDLKVIIKAQKFRLQKSKIKTMLITFFDKQGVTHLESVSEGQTANSAFYVEVIGRFESRPGHRLTWLTYLVVFLSPSRQMPG